MPKVIFENDKDVIAVEGESILEVSLKNEIPHIHACGGKGRCSTCRVIVLEKQIQLPPRNEKESKIAEVKGFEENIRLACQTPINQNLKVRRLVKDKDDIDEAITQRMSTTGKEETLAILFSDIRGYTSFSEKSLAYDTVHILNRYFKAVGDEILKYQGFIDKYLGDGIMAVFGLNKYVDENPCMQAIKAGLGMLSIMNNFNRYLKANFNTEFAIGIGIHYGVAISGDIGHPAKKQCTVIGDTVNVASRIESANKELGTNLLISEAVYKEVKSKIKVQNSFTVNLKGKENAYTLYEPVYHFVKGEDCKDQLREFLFNELAISEVPSLLRLSFHDACSYNPVTKKGGLQARIFVDGELEKEVHNGLLPAALRIKELHRKINDKLPTQFSLSDVMAVSCCIGIEKCGGPYIPIKIGRKDYIIEDSTLNPPFTEEWNLSSILQRFTEMGFSKKEVVALNGTHTLGKIRGNFFTEDPYSFNNSFFKRLLSTQTETVLLPTHPTLEFAKTDLLFLQDEECKKYIEKYSVDERLFFKDFSEAFAKLMNLGQDL